MDKNDQPRVRAIGCGARSAIWGLTLLLLFPLPANADVLVAWDVDGVDVETDLSAMDSYAFGATSSNASGNVGGYLSLGGGVNPSTTAGQYGFKISGNDEQESLAGALDNNHYIQVSLQINSGYTIDLESIVLKGQASSAGCSNVVLMSSMDGFAVGKEIHTFFPANQTGGLDASIDLSALNYTNQTGTVDFRLYGWNSSSGSGITYIRNLSGDDLVINGTIEAIPEPAALSFVGLVGVAALITKRFV